MVRLSLLVSDDAQIVDYLPQKRTAEVLWGAVAITERGGWSGEALTELFARTRCLGGAWDLCLIAEVEQVLCLLIKHLYKKSGAKSVELHLSVYDSGSLFWLRPVLTECCRRLMREERFIHELLFSWHVFSIERCLLPAEAMTKSTLAVQVAAKQGRSEQAPLAAIDVLQSPQQTAQTTVKPFNATERWLIAGIVAGGVTLCAVLSLFFL